MMNRMDTKYLGLVCDLCLSGTISPKTFSTVKSPMANRPLEQREWIASRIIELAENMSSEEDLIAKVKAASPQWLEELKLI